MIDFMETEVRAAKCIVVAFTGVMHGLGGIPFEFHRSLGQLDCAALFVRDLGRRWYQYTNGDVQAAATRIRLAIARSGAERSLFLGNSMGGFGALLFGSLCDAQAILGFAAQTAIDPAVTTAMGDTRWNSFQERIPSYPYGDLAALRAGYGRIVLCCGAGEPLDAVHADRLARTWRLDKMIVPNSTHDVASRLRERGELVPLISSFLQT
jgi:hypothetical protein